jgi:hypothetical protein
MLVSLRRDLLIETQRCSRCTIMQSLLCHRQLSSAGLCRGHERRCSPVLACKRDRRSQQARGAGLGCRCAAETGPSTSGRPHVGDERISELLRRKQSGAGGVPATSSKLQLA